MKQRLKVNTYRHQHPSSKPCRPQYTLDQLLSDWNRLIYRTEKKKEKKIYGNHTISSTRRYESYTRRQVWDRRKDTKDLKDLRLQYRVQVRFK